LLKKASDNPQLFSMMSTESGKIVRRVYKKLSDYVWKKYLPDVVSVPERKEPPLSIDPSNPSVDKLLSASWPPGGLCSGIETTR
jgi:hypothetical protein